MEGSVSNTIQPSTEVPPTNLGDMPVKIAEQIIAPLDAMTKRSLRLTSKDLKSVVDRSPVTYHEVKLTLVDNAQEIHIEMLIDEENQLKLEFLKTPTGCLIRNRSEAWEKQEFDPHEIHFITKASEHVVKIIGNALITVENLAFIFDIPEFRSRDISPAQYNFVRTHRLFLFFFKRHLDRCLNHRLNVKNVKFVSYEDYNNSFEQLLPFLEPGTLEKITWLCGMWRVSAQEMSLEQFRRAKVLVTDGSFKPNDFGQFEHIHFMSTYHQFRIDLSEHLNSLRTLNAAWQTVRYDFDRSIDHVLSRFIDETPMEMRRPNSPKHIKILNTDDFMKIEVSENTVLITKVNFF